MPGTSVPNLLAGRYRLESRIASGGFGAVWRGTDTILARSVAIKLLRAEFAEDTATLRRFRDEARHTGSLAHQNIVRVYDYDAPGSVHPAFLVMEFVDGPSLAEVLADGPMEPRKVMDLVAQAAAGLHAAHGSGLVHCDVKPGNILFTPDGTVKLTDFGISRAVGSAPVTASGALVGTPAYLAPERVARNRSTAAGDLYALGVVAYECLAGELPFRGPPIEVALAQQSRPMPPLPAGIPADVAELVSQLTAKDPAVRPGSAGEVAIRAGALRDGAIPEGRAGQGSQDGVWTAVAPAAQGHPEVVDTITHPLRVPVSGFSGRRAVRSTIVLSTAVVVAALIALLLAGVFHPGSHRPASAAKAPATMVEVDGKSLTGRPVAAVRGYLRHLGLVVRVRWRPSDRLTAGRVLSVRPTGRVAAGSTVVVVGALRPAAGPATSVPPSAAARPRRQGHHSGRGQPPRPTGGPTPAGSPSPKGSPSPTGSSTPTPGPTPTAGPAP